MFSPCHVSQSLLLYGKLMHRVLRSAGWLWPSLTQLRPDIRTFQRLPPEEAEQKPRGTDSACHTVIHQPSTPHTQNTHTHTHTPPAALARGERREVGVDGALWPRTVDVNTSSVLPPSYPKVWFAAGYKEPRPRGGCESPRWWVEDREGFCQGMVGDNQRGRWLTPR